MGRIGLKNRVGIFDRKKIVIAVLAVALIAGIIFGGSKLFGKDDDVKFRVLSEAEIPQQIAAQIIPEYRQLERALASMIDDKVYVVATRGEKPTSGYDLEIAKMTLEKDGGTNTLIVFVKFKDPQPGMSLTQVLTYPLLVAETELADLPDLIEMRVQYVD